MFFFQSLPTSFRVVARKKSLFQGDHRTQKREKITVANASISSFLASYSFLDFIFVCFSCVFICLPARLTVIFKWRQVGWSAAKNCFGGWIEVVIYQPFGLLMKTSGAGIKRKYRLTQRSYFCIFNLPTCCPERLWNETILKKKMSQQIRTEYVSYGVLNDKMVICLKDGKFLYKLTCLGNKENMQNIIFFF